MNPTLILQAYLCQTQVNLVLFLDEAECFPRHSARALYRCSSVKRHCYSLQHTSDIFWRLLKATRNRKRMKLWQVHNGHNFLLVSYINDSVKWTHVDEFIFGTKPLNVTPCSLVECCRFSEDSSALISCSACSSALKMEATLPSKRRGYSTGLHGV